ncbi:uncharacterized protein LOC128744529 [Sabethes cyaneus]|uniref:uncharacterized protein LOC128744529 n=1 Tax=Sabethes cyaneus TaxID=53552 RepID=UPI00237D4772|nr:uncharacterized protein LOC128744529 [Sabethes cyaneus]
MRSTTLARLVQTTKKKPTTPGISLFGIPWLFGPMYGDDYYQESDDNSTTVMPEDYNYGELGVSEPMEAEAQPELEVSPPNTPKEEENLAIVTEPAPATGSTRMKLKRRVTTTPAPTTTTRVLLKRRVTAAGA